MNNILGKIISAAVLAFSLTAVSCQKDDTIRYGNITMGNVTDGVFVSDQGNIFNVVEQTCSGQLDTMKRAIVVCDILRKTEGAEGSYDVRLTQMGRVLTKDPVEQSGITDEDILVTDPVHVKEIWYSGGYLNFYLMFPIKPESTDPHLINLVLEDESMTGNSCTFELRHNGFGEVWSEENNDYVLAGAYVSFPIGNMIGSDKAEVTLKWKWHKLAGSGWTLAVVDNEIKFNWVRESFEQAPLSLATKTAMEIM